MVFGSTYDDAIVLSRKCIVVYFSIQRRDRMQLQVKSV
jgi:hypothetical protein